jgi:uncharacterized membrane protein
MKNLIDEFLKPTLIGGLLIILPLGLIAFLITRSLAVLKPITDSISPYLPERFRYPILIALVLLLLICFAVGLVAQTKFGQRLGIFIEASVLNYIPGYTLLRSLTQRVGDAEESRKFAPAFVEVEESLVPAFVIEEHDDGRYTVFVPSVPTPAVGALYVMRRERVHIVDAPFMDAVKCVSRFGEGTEKLLSSMRPR